VFAEQGKGGHLVKVQSTKCYIGRLGSILLFIVHDIGVNQFGSGPVALPLSKPFIFKVGFMLGSCW
jgi:hypothetical protein